MTSMFIYDDGASQTHFDMTQWAILNDFAAGDFGRETSTKFTLFGTGVEYVFTGTDLTYDSNGVPTGGTISHLREIDTTYDNHNIVGVKDFNITVQQLDTFALTNDVSGFENSVFGSGGDTYTISAHYQTVHIVGTDGDDTFRCPYGPVLNTADTLDGGAGTNTIIFNGGAGGGVSAGVPLLLQQGMLENIQDIVLKGNLKYDVELIDPNISGGKTLTLDAHALPASDPVMAFVFYQSVNVNFIGTPGNDQYIGSLGDDQITGGLGSDVLSGITGHNTFIYHSAAESSGASADAITDFVASKDHFQMPVAVNAMDAPITTGTLDYGANFDAELQVALKGHLNAGDALLFTPDSGNLAGFTILVVDQNGHAGYQSGHDIVIQLGGHNTDLTGFSAANFIT